MVEIVQCVTCEINQVEITRNKHGEIEQLNEFGEVICETCWLDGDVTWDEIREDH